MVFFIDKFSCICYDSHRYLLACIAQLVEQLTCNEQVIRSSRITSSNPLHLAAFAFQYNGRSLLFPVIFQINNYSGVYDD